MSGPFNKTCPARVLADPNAWAEGPRRLACLRCERLFRSDSKALRLCPDCRTADGDFMASRSAGRRRRAELVPDV